MPKIQKPAVKNSIILAFFLLCLLFSVDGLALPDCDFCNDNVRSQGLHKAVDEWIGGGDSKKTVIALYGQITDWDVSQCTNMRDLFNGASLQQNPYKEFNADISNWKTSRVTAMEKSEFLLLDLLAYFIFNQFALFHACCATVFQSAENFNVDISKFDTSSVKNMASMFASAFVFNQDISKWSTQQVTDLN